MNKVLKKAVFHISVCKNDGISESKLLKLLHEDFDGVFSFRDEDVLALIRKTPEILLKSGDTLIKAEHSNKNASSNKKSERTFVAEKDLQNHILKNNLLNRHFHNDDNQEDSEAIFQMYQEIVKAGAAGISYEELSDIFAKKGIKGLTKQKLDSYMVSNYCCKLAKHNFINITFQNLRRMVIDVRFNKVALENFLNPNKKNPDGNTSVANINSEEAGDQQKKQQNQKEINSVTQENIIEYLNKETFTIRELSQRQNIVLNLQSHFAQKNDGLTTKEICLRIRMLHEKKALDRIIKSIEKAYKVETIAARMGKSYSHKFVIRHTGVKNYKPPIEFTSDIKLEDPETYGLVKAENEDAESSSDVVNASSSAKKSHLPPVLHYEVFKDILEILTENKQFREFVEGKGEDLANLKEVKQSDEDYAKTAERILMILVDNESKLFNENTAEPETRGGFSKKSLTRLKLNRYIFILNKVREHEVTTNILLKTMIINEIEVGTGWKIDRKTLRQLLNLLQKLGLIKLQDYKINYPFNNNYKGSNEAKEDVMYTRVVVLARKVSANDPRIQTLLSKSNMANLKKEAEAGKLSMNRKRGLLDKEAIFLEDQDIELSGATLKKVKPLKDQIEAMKKKKEEFENMTGDAATKLKKFDFASCKLMAKEYKLMMFGSYFEALFKKKINAMKQLTLKNLRKYETIRIYEYIDATDKTLSSSISGIVGRRRHPMGLGSKNLDIIKALTTSTASQSSILSYDVKNRNLCEDIGKRFEKDFYTKMEAENEVAKILQQSQSQSASTPNKRLQSLFNFSKNNQGASSHRSFLEQVEKRFHNNSVLLNDEDRQKRQRDQARLANLITTCPVKNVDQVLAKHAKIPERKEVMEHMGISEELIFKEVEPMFNVNSMIVEPESYKFITRPVPIEELDKVLDRKNIYYSTS